MPSAPASHAYPRRQPARRPAPRRARAGAAAGAAARVRWDRLGRVAMLCVLGALLYLYLSAGIHFLSTWGQARHDSAALSSLQREHVGLVHQHEALSRRSTLEAEARRLGMVRANEQPYVVGGLPRN